MSQRTRNLGVAALFSAWLFFACSQELDPDPGLPTWTLSEEWRIGNGDGEATSLYSVSAAARLGSNLYVLETMTPRVAKFSDEGEWMGDFAPMGDGPGEVRRPRNIGTLGDRIWVEDAAGARLEVYSAVGEPLESMRFDIPPDSNGLRAFPIALLSDGSVLAGHGWNFGIGQVLVGGVTHSSYYRASPSGDVLGLLLDAPIPDGDYFDAPFSAERRIAGRHPLPQAPLVAAFPDGSGVVAVERWVPESGDLDAFRFRIWDELGTLELDEMIPFVPVPGGDWLDRRIEEMRSSQIAARGEANEAQLDAFREHIAPRPYLPPVTALRPGVDSSIWLRREETAHDSVEWQIIDRQGGAIAMLLAPKGLTFLLVSREEGLAVERDALDVEFLVKYRIKR